ncbi:hypothetical protein C5N14_17900 [Micromonospora sp. MW-13]|nr:hypothetical protein C5N14_17900 [Micromonospora sp. MW-13]
MRAIQLRIDAWLSPEQVAPYGLYSYCWAKYGLVYPVPSVALTYANRAPLAQAVDQS